MKFSKRSVKVQSFTSYIAFRSLALTAIGYEILATKVETAQVSGSFTWTPLDELLELAAIPEILVILDTVSMQ